MKLSIVLPCYNEAENVVRIPQELMPYLAEIGYEYEIILVDDGSADETVGAAERLGIEKMKIVRHPKNMGPGRAFMTAIENMESDLCVFLDADFTFHPRYIKDLLVRFNQGDVDFVGGSPRLAKEGEYRIWWRDLISDAANFVYKILFGSEVTTSTGFFRLYVSKDLKELDLEASGFNISAEILYKLLLKGKHYAEVPVPLTTREFGQSKLNYKKEVLNHIKLLTRILFQRFRFRQKYGKKDSN
jgi:dolichol-phosphate mannosyltransferase